MEEVALKVATNTNACRVNAIYRREQQITNIGEPDRKRSKKKRKKEKQPSTVEVEGNF
jgi:hypothetical protein